MYDILILGGGPAGISAALTARNRGKSVLLLSGDPADNPLFRAKRLDNYPGMPAVSGKEMLCTMQQQAENAGVEQKTAIVTAVMPMEDHFLVSVGQELCQGKKLILAIGLNRAKPFPGEREFLGRGVSYCATCDGMFYREKTVAVLGLSAHAEQEAEFLRSIGCRVLYFTEPRGYEITGTQQVEAITVRGQRHPVSGVFILRGSLAPAQLLPGLEIAGEHIAVNGAMETNLPGVYACGDCTGQPYQVAKAVGEGNIAALSACRALDSTVR